jgi:hydroxybutyrate-dimer hydrolase
MDLMYAHLTAGAPLPPSQVVRTTPRGGTPGSAPAISSANVPPISASPATADLITFTNSTVIVPD